MLSMDPFLRNDYDFDRSHSAHIQNCYTYRPPKPWSNDKSPRNSQFVRVIRDLIHPSILKQAASRGTIVSFLGALSWGEGLLSLCFAMGFISFWWQASFWWELEGRARGHGVVQISRQCCHLLNEKNIHTWKKSILSNIIQKGLKSPTRHLYIFTLFNRIQSATG